MSLTCKLCNEMVFSETIDLPLPYYLEKKRAQIPPGIDKAALLPMYLEAHLTTKHPGHEWTNRLTSSDGDSWLINLVNCCSLLGCISMLEGELPAKADHIARQSLAMILTLASEASKAHDLGLILAPMAKPDDPEVSPEPETPA